MRIRDEDKAALDALQAKFLLSTGRRLSLEELLGRIIELAEAREEDLLTEGHAPTLSAEALDAYQNAGRDWGVVTREEDIDEVLYGGEDPA